MAAPVDFLAGGGSAGLLWRVAVPSTSWRVAALPVSSAGGRLCPAFLAGGGSAGFLAGGGSARLFGGRRLSVDFVGGGFLAGLVPMAALRRLVRRRVSRVRGQGPADVHAQFLQFGLHRFPVLLRRRRREFLLVEPRANLLVLFIAVAVERIRGLDIPMIVFLS